MAEYDTVVIGAGPNGFAAAIEIARAGLSVLVIEAHKTPGGGTRTIELTLPGFLHDVCSSVHPLGVASPFFQTLDLGAVGLRWVDPPAPLAHIVDERTVVTLERSIDDTSEQLGSADKLAYKRLMSPFAARFSELCEMVLGPLRIPSSPALLARFGLVGLQSMLGLAHVRFRREEARGLLGGIAAHAMLPLDTFGTASFGLILGAAGHAVGWPIARKGSQSIASALQSRLRGLGGELELDRPIRSMRDLPRARAYVFDVTPRQLLEIAGDDLPPLYRERLRGFRYGPGVFKVDWALRAPIPWRNPACLRAATVHLAGTIDEIARGEAAAFYGTLPTQPFVLLVQPTLFDPTRAPPGKHTAWAYCHVPHGSAVNALQAIEDQIERFAPGFRDVVLDRRAHDTFAMEAHNSNYVGGDINGGQADLGQLFFRPLTRIDPYATANPRIFICSSSTPPGGGVHGMCGYWAARSVLARAFQRGTRLAPATPENATLRPFGEQDEPGVNRPRTV